MMCASREAPLIAEDFWLFGYLLHRVGGTPTWRNFAHWHPFLELRPPRYLPIKIPFFPHPRSPFKNHKILDRSYA